MIDPGRAARPGLFLFAALVAIGGAGPAATPVLAQPSSPVQQKALLIAVQKYDDPRLNLTVTLQDSNELKKTLIERAGIPIGNLTLMNDEAPPEFRPTLANVRRELRLFLEGAEPTDRLLIFFSGHGFIHEGQTFLVLADFDMKNHAKTGLPAFEVREALTRSQAAVKFLVLDCCQAGGEKALPDPSLVDPQLMAKGLELQRVPGCVVLASCQAEEKSYEWAERHQSVFTYWFCRALDGGADKDGNGKISADEVYEYTFDRVTKTVAQMTGGRTQTPVRQVGVGVVGVTDVITLLPESPESLCERLAAHLDLELRLRKLKKVGVLEFLEPYGQVEGLAKSNLPAYCAEKVRDNLTRLAGTGYTVLNGPQFRRLVRGMPIADVGDPRAMKRLAAEGGDLDAVISGTLRRRGQTMALTSEMIATSTGDTLASPSGKLPLTESLLADDGLSFDSQNRPAGTPFDGHVVDYVLAQTARENPLRRRDFPFRVDIVSVQPPTGQNGAGKARRFLKPFLGDRRDGPGADPNELVFAARQGEIFEVQLTNTSKRRVGVALLIDGISTLGKRRERVEKARLWVVDPGQTNVVDGWHETVAPGGPAQDGEERMTSRQFVFNDIAQSVAGRQQFGDAIGTITAAFFDEKPREAGRGLGVDEGVEKGVVLKTVPFVPGRLLGAINIKYVEESLSRNPAAPR